MGLDMYLTKQIYVGAHYEHRAVTGSIDITIGNDKLPIDFNKVSYVTEQVGYWRKANAIHSWFVKNVQDGVDNCARYYVDHIHLETLLRLVNLVLEDNSRAEELLPSVSGFFFGSTQYDGDYFDDLKITKEIVEEALPESEDASFYYQASW